MLLIHHDIITVEDIFMFVVSTCLQISFKHIKYRLHGLCKVCLYIGLLIQFSPQISCTCPKAKL